MVSWVAWKKMIRSKKEGGLGFRDLTQFNRALLANQVWKLLARPTSLVFRVLQNKYFPHGSMLSTQATSRSSYGWRSLLSGRDLLIKGLRVSIGNGQNTKIGIDPWLPTIPARPPRLKSSINPYMSVATIIDQVIQCWNIPRITNIVDETDVALIQSIYLSHKKVQDRYIWNHTNHGHFTVRSGYRLAMQEAYNINAPLPPLHHIPDLAQRIWKISTAPKLNHFCWRILSGALALKSNLHRRNITANTECDRCGEDIEDANHVFFRCPYAQASWRIANSPYQGFVNPSNNIENNIKQLFDIIDNARLEDFHRHMPLWLIWRIWKSRNALAYSGRVFTPEETVKQAHDDTIEWLHHTINIEELGDSEVLQDASHTGMGMWTKPPQGWVKCNFDASLPVDGQGIGIGWIIRDHLGAFKHCGMSSSVKRASVDEAESEGLIWAMQSLWNLGYKQVIFEGDCLTLIQAIHHSRRNFRLERYLDDIDVWKNTFTNVQFRFSNRNTNKCADGLAKEGITTNAMHIIFHECPPFIRSIHENDCNHI